MLIKKDKKRRENGIRGYELSMTVKDVCDRESGWKGKWERGRCKAGAGGGGGVVLEGKKEEKEKKESEGR